MSDDQEAVEGLQQLTLSDGASNRSESLLPAAATVQLVPFQSESDIQKCCKSRECLKKISPNIKQSCHQAGSEGGVLYVSQYIHPHIEGPPDTKQSFIYKVPDESDQEVVVCQKAFKFIFGISQYCLQQAQGAAIKRMKGKDKASKQVDMVDASPQRKRSSGMFRRLRKGVSKRLHMRRSSSDIERKQKEESTVIQSIQFNLSKAEIIKKPSHILGKCHQINNSQSRQTATWKTSQTRTTARTYEWHWNDQTAISSEAELTVGLPVVVAGEISLGAANMVSVGNKRVMENGETDKWEFDLPGTVEPMSKLTIILKAEKCRVSVPVVATLRKGSKIWKENGVYVGTQYLNAHVFYE